MDDTLIDIKVTKHLKLERDYINQVIGYYILALIGGINKNHNGTSIRNIGIYFARHGLLWKVPLTELGNKSKFSSFKNWFSAYFYSLRSEKLKEINEQFEQINKQIAKKQKLSRREKPAANIGLALWRLTKRSINFCFANRQQFQLDRTQMGI